MTKPIFAWSRAYAILLAAWPLISANADEGMWTLDNFPSAAVAAAYGADVDPQALGRLSLATVRIEGGCTGSFVSPNGLILTNQHCIQRCLTQWTDATNDRRRDGFLAASRADELACDTEQVSVLVGADEVTAPVAAAIEGLAVDEANEVRKATLTRLENECRENHVDDGLVCEAVTLYHGGQVFMYRYRRFDDVRLVFAPEQAIAAFGGDPDNFNFPRWCFDVAFLRAYDDGAPAATPAHLPIRRAGAQPGEVVFVAGHPGSTQRLKTLAYWQLLRDTVLPSDIEYYAELRGRLRQFRKGGAAERRATDAILRGIENRLKVYRQRLRALADARNVAVKSEWEAATRAAAVASEGVGEELDALEAQVTAAVSEYRLIFDRHTLIEKRRGFDGVLFGYAKSLVRAAAERDKPEPERLRAYTDEALAKLEQRIVAPRPINVDLEKLRLSFGLEKLQERLGPDDEFVKLVLRRRGPDALAAELIDASQLADPAVRRRLWFGGTEAIEASTDPLIRLALAIEPEARAIRQRFDDEVEARLVAAETALAQMRFRLYGTDNYPDATFSLRISYGAIRGWREGEREVGPFTTYAELGPRVTGTDPFALPPSWQDVAIAGDTRFNQASSNDVIGGNSGSALTNLAGELVGVVFDGNIHAIPGAYFYDATRNRTVSVHTDILLEALAGVYSADALLNELTLR